MTMKCINELCEIKCFDTICGGCQEEWNECYVTITRKDELLREAANYLEDAVNAMEQSPDEWDPDYDNERDLITRIRKELSEEK